MYMLLYFTFLKNCHFVFLNRTSQNSEFYLFSEGIKIHAHKNTPNCGIFTSVTVYLLTQRRKNAIFVETENHSGF